MTAEIRDIDVTKTWVLESTLNFTRYFFRQNYGKKFIVNHHHRTICDVLDKVIKGEITRLIINLAPRYGKAIDCETDMLTTDGWKKAKDIKVGDYLFGRDGKPTKVLAVFPQGVTDAFKVTFSDKSSIVTCGEHLWEVKNRNQRGRKWKYKNCGSRTIKTTKELEGNIIGSDNHKLWHLPTCEPLDLPERELPIDPYLFGCWLGDGHTHTASITTMDNEIIEKFSEYDPVIRTHQNSGRAITYGLRNNFVSKLKELGVFKNKHIPIQYLLASKQQRLELLRGLCDTDGTCNKQNGQVSFCSTNRILFNNVRELILSLGYYCTAIEHNLFFRSEDCPFNLDRKKQYFKQLNNRHFTKRYFAEITKVEDRETVCFTVDAEDHLFRAGRDLIITHNTEIAVKNFVAYGLAINPSAKFIHLSYSDDLARDNSREVQNTVKTEEYARLFGVELASESTKKWHTTAGGGMYAISSGGQVTGFGAGAVDYETEAEEAESIDEFIPYFHSKFAGAIIIDDPIKPDDALSDQKREAVNQKFDTTIRNRVNSRKTPIIVIMQRLHQNDLCGYLQKLEGVVGKDEGGEWTVLELPCLYEEDGEPTALWPHKHTVEELQQLRIKNPFVFETQYQMNPKPKEGLMYDRGFRTYSVVPYSHVTLKKNYTDVADTGSDYLCSICYTETEAGMFVEDILYTQKSQEYTEPKQAEMLAKHETETANIESNNGGRSYGRNVETQTRIIGNKVTEFSFFHQSQNKQVRIFSRANEAMNLIYFPEGWDKMWPIFYQHVTGYMKTGKNKFDDAPDTLTGMCEFFGEDEGDSAEGYF